MKRRTRLLIGIVVLVGGVSQGAEQLQWRINNDGRFDIVAEANRPAILDCYPAFDDKLLTPKSVRITRNDQGGQAVYQLSDGSVILNFKKDKDSVYIETTLKGFKFAPHWVYPLAHGEISGASRFFKQGLGFGGPSGVFRFSPAASWHSPNEIKEDVWSYDSFMTSALIAEDGVIIAAGAYEHKNFLQRSTYYNRQHRTGLVDKSPATNVTFYEAGFSTERIPIKSGELKLPALHFVVGDSPFEALRQLAQNIGRASKARLDKPSRYYFDSWYEYEWNYNLEKLEDLLAGLNSMKPRIPLQGVLIDSGYCLLGDWLFVDENDYPGGLKTAFKKIIDAGYRAGSYTGPFMVSSRSELFRNHPDWVLRDLNDKPLLDSKGKPFIDGKSDYEERYYLDTSNPEAFDYLRQVFRTHRAWGATLYKTDFMDWGLKDSTMVKRHTPGRTSVQYFVDVLAMIREEIGEESYWLDCISPFSPAIGYVDGMRVSYDAVTEWSAGSNLDNVINEMLAGQYFNNVLWQNDPDVIFLRQTKLSDAEVQSLALWSGISGGTITTSDRFHKLPAERLKLWRFIQPAQKQITAVFPLWYGDKKLVVAVRAYPDGKSWAVLVFNNTPRSAEDSYILREVIGQGSAYCFEWHPGGSKPLGKLNNLSQKLDAHQSILYYISQDDNAPAADMGLAGLTIPGLGEVKE
jgi:hypothetical protein